MIFFSTFNHLVNQKITFLYTFLYVQYPLASESRWGGPLTSTFSAKKDINLHRRSPGILLSTRIRFVPLYSR